MKKEFLTQIILIATFILKVYFQIQQTNPTLSSHQSPLQYKVLIIFKGKRIVNLLHQIINHL